MSLEDGPKHHSINDSCLNDQLIRANEWEFIYFNEFIPFINLQKSR